MVGEGTEPENENNMIHLPQPFVVRGNSIGDLITAVYGDIKVNYDYLDYTNCRILMCTKNDTSYFISEYVMNMLPGEGRTFLSADSVPEEQATLYPTDFLNSIMPSGLSPHKLYLKEYASIILLRSLDSTGGMCNGTRLTVRSLSNRLIDVEIATGVFMGKRVFIPRIPMTPTDSDFPFVLRRRQFPIRPAFCITINKGQGQSMKKVGLFLPTPESIFSHGQLYVALSRVQHPSGLKVMISGGTSSTSGGLLVRMWFTVKYFRIIWSIFYPPAVRAYPLWICPFLPPSSPSLNLTTLL